MDDVADRGGPNVRCINFGQEPVLAPAHTADPKLVLLEFARIEDGVRRAQTLVEAPCSGVLNPSRTFPSASIQPMATISSLGR